MLVPDPMGSEDVSLQRMDIVLENVCPFFLSTHELCNDIWSLYKNFKI